MTGGAAAASLWAKRRRDAGIAAPPPPPHTTHKPRRALTAAEKRDLIKRFQNGDRGAGGALLHAHESLIWRAARGDEDKMQAARIGLLSAASAFDLSRDNRLAAFGRHRAWWSAALEHGREARHRHVSLDDSCSARDERPIGSRIAWPGATPEAILIALENYGLWVWR